MDALPGRGIEVFWIKKPQGQSGSFACFLAFCPKVTFATPDAAQQKEKEQSLLASPVDSRKNCFSSPLGGCIFQVLIDDQDFIFCTYEPKYAVHQKE